MIRLGEEDNIKQRVEFEASRYRNCGVQDSKEDFNLIRNDYKLKFITDKVEALFDAQNNQPERYNIAAETQATSE